MPAPLSPDQPMSQTPIAALVLAAGKSTRMKSKTPKTLHKLLGKPIIHFLLEAVQEAGVERTILVVGHQADAVKELVGPEYEYVLQEEQLGTGHAVIMAEPLLGDWKGAVLVVPGDAPLITAGVLRELIQRHTSSAAAATVLTAVLDDAGSYGRIVRNASADSIVGIVEAKDATSEELKIQEINTSVYLFNSVALFSALKSIRPANAQGEYYLTDVVGHFVREGLIVDALVSSDPDIGRGINTRVEMVELSAILRDRVQRELMLSGVTIIDPATTHIDAGVQIGQDTIIQPFTILSGVTDIGEDCEIGPGARITDSKIGNGVSIKDSFVVASEVGDGTRIGPFANLRPGSTVGRNVKIGDFIELKGTDIADNVSVGHFAYLGDASVGSGTNVGAGVITCNWDGAVKSKTIIGSNVFLGSNTTLVAPVSVGDGSFTAAGSVITENVPEDALAIGRARQINKEEWAVRKRAERPNRH